MRVLMAPAAFDAGLGAVQVAAAMARGWRARSPGDEVLTVPVAGPSDPGMVTVLQHRLGGELNLTTVPGATGAPVPVPVLVVPGPVSGRTGPTAYVDGVGVLEAPWRSATAADGGAGPDADTATDPGTEARERSSLGLGVALEAARASGARRVVLLLGSSDVLDGGAGLLAGLGAHGGADGSLTGGVSGVAGLTAVDLTEVRRRWADVELVLATDASHPLLGLRGVANLDGARLGLGDEDRLDADAALERFAGLLTPALPGLAAEARSGRGAGAGGGVGFAVRALGGRIAPAFGTLAEHLGLPAAAADADVVVTGREVLDWQSLDAGASGAVVGVAGVATRALRPCVVVAGEVAVGNRELRVHGIEAAYDVREMAGSVSGDAADAVTAAVQRVARTWSRR